MVLLLAYQLIDDSRGIHCLAALLSSSSSESIPEEATDALVSDESEKEEEEKEDPGARTRSSMQYTDSGSRDWTLKVIIRSKQL